MSAALPGVKVGPLDPDATEAFGRVAQGNTARQLIRLHRQLHPPQLVRALARPLDVSHTKAVRENLDEVRGYLGGLSHDNGDPLVPEHSEVIDAAVRGDKATGQVLTFQYRLRSGRVGKWHAPYAEDHLPDSYAIGREYAQIKEMKDRGVVAFDSEATGQEVFRRRAQDLERENRRLRAVIEGRSDEVPGDSDGDESSPEVSQDTRQTDAIVEENELLRRELEEMRPRLAQFEALQAAGGGGMPMAGLEEHQQGAGDETVASENPPFESYEDLKADELANRIKDEGTSQDEVRAILEYERTHANRKSVVGAAEQRLDAAS